MAPDQPTCCAIVLSALDVPDARRLLVYGCEDCACAVDTSTPPAAAPAPVQDLPPGARWVRGPEIVNFPLDGGYRALFNPAGNYGVAVVNPAGYRLFRRFHSPATLSQAAADWPGPAQNFTAAFNRLAGLEMVHPAAVLPRPRFPESRQLTAWLHITNACNLRCPYCYLTKTNEEMDESTGRAAVEAVIRSAAGHGFGAVKLKYAGGEASLNYRLVLKLHSYAQTLAGRRGLALHGVLLSNGVSFPKKLVEALKAANIRVMISLDGVGRYHNRQRPFANGRPSFHLVEQTITRLQQAGWPPHLSITVTGRNLAGLPQAVRFALDRDLTFSLNFYRKAGTRAGVGDLPYREQAMIDALLAAFEVIEAQLPRWSVLGAILDRGQLVQPRQYPCGVGRDYVVINQRGQVARCHMEIERTLGDVFRFDPLRLVRQNGAGLQNPPVEEKLGCGRCPWRYGCTGGCPVATANATGRAGVKSPNCNIYRAIYPAAIRLEGLRLLKYAAFPAVH